jgi:hypothetical protein
MDGTRNHIVRKMNYNGLRLREKELNKAWLQLRILLDTLQQKKRKVLLMTCLQPHTHFHPCQVPTTLRLDIEILTTTVAANSATLHLLKLLFQ